MKHQTIKKGLMGLGSLIFLAILMWVSFKHPDWLLYFGVLTCLPGYLLLLICFTPLGSIRLGKPEERLSRWAWWGGLLKGHGVLILFTFVVFVGFFGGGPAFVPPIDFVVSLQAVQHYTQTEWGIFPWGVYALWAVGIAYMVYVKKAPPYLYALARGIFPKPLEPMIKSAGEGIQFGATLLAIALVAGSSVLVLSYIVEKYYKISHFIVAPITMSFFSIFVILFSFKSTRFAIRHRSHWLSMAHMVSMCIVMLTGILIIAAFANQWFATHHSEIVAQSVCHACQNYFTQVPQSTRFSALYWAWWLIWVPLAGSYLASLAKGRTVRELVLGLFSFPLVMWLMMKAIVANGGLPGGMLVVYGCIVIAPFLAWWVLVRMLKKVQHSDFFHSGYMHCESDLSRGRLSLDQGVKTVGIARYGMRAVMLIFGTVLFQTIAGWYGLQIQALPIGFMVIWAIYSALFALLIRLFKNP